MTPREQAPSSSSLDSRATGLGSCTGISEKPRRDVGPHSRVSGVDAGSLSSGGEFEGPSAGEAAGRELCAQFPSAAGGHRLCSGGQGMKKQPLCGIRGGCGQLFRAVLFCCLWIHRACENSVCGPPLLPSPSPQVPRAGAFALHLGFHPWFPCGCESQPLPLNTEVVSRGNALFPCRQCRSWPSLPLCALLCPRVFVCVEGKPFSRGLLPRRAEFPCRQLGGLGAAYRGSRGDSSSHQEFRPARAPPGTGKRLPWAGSLRSREERTRPPHSSTFIFSRGLLRLQNVHRLGVGGFSISFSLPHSPSTSPP